MLFRSEKMFDTGESVGVFKLDGQDVVTGWSAAGKLLTPDENGVTADRLVSLQQQFERAEAYTVTFDLNKPERANPVRPTSAVADVDWICAGNTIRRRLVIASGTTISGLANAIRISIRDQSGITGVAPGTLAREYVVSVSVSRGTRVPTVSPPLAPLANTDQFVTVTNPMVKSITIPINIGVNAVAVIPGKLTSGGVQVDIRFRDVICTLVDPLNNILEIGRASCRERV